MGNHISTKILRKKIIRKTRAKPISVKELSETCHREITNMANIMRQLQALGFASRLDDGLYFTNENQFNRFNKIQGES